MKLEEAQAYANKVVEAIRDLCDRIEVAGSIRRKKKEVNDIDIVAIPKYIQAKSPLGTTISYGPSETWRERIPGVLMCLPLKLLGHAFGSELMRLSFRENGLQVDIYRARPETWGILLLVRTGSIEHNMKLCNIAKSKGLKLSASQGVVTQAGFGEIIASNTEEEIFAALGLPYIDPRNREV